MQRVIVSPIDAAAPGVSRYALHVPVQGRASRAFDHGSAGVHERGCDSKVVPARACGLPCGLPGHLRQRVFPLAEGALRAPDQALNDQHLRLARQLWPP